MAGTGKITLQSAITELKGIGEKRAKLFNKLNIFTVSDLLNHKPNYYKDLNDLKPIYSLSEGEYAVIKARVFSEPKWIRRTKAFSLFSFDVTDGTGTLQIHIFNIPYLFSKYKIGDEYIFFGKVKAFYRKLQMDNPEVQTIENGQGMIPYYPLTSGISQSIMRKTIKAALDQAEIPDTFSDAFLSGNNLLKDELDYRYLHDARNKEEVQASSYSLSFKELLVYLGVMNEAVVKKSDNEPLNCGSEVISEFTDKLPFKCTEAQKRAMRDILDDFNKETVSNRLVQGDVGSGKTVVAFFAAYLLSKYGYQSVIIAPTSLLAEQHYSNAVKYFGEDVALLTGSTSEKERRVLEEKLLKEEVKILISTHAVLYDRFVFTNLKLVLIDEQQRFGVVQRSHLINKYPDVHLITMTATPIPRSLAMILSGSADITLIDEMPSNRKAVNTFIVTQHKRNDMYDWITDRIKNNDDKVYIVCPLVEESEGINAVSVHELYKDLKERYKDVPMDFIHGKVKNDDRNVIMDRFKEGKIKLLISSTVIETGVDVTDATIIVIENADRFGLAQLHQLRGRVGRGEKESFCYLVNSSNEANERLDVLKKSTNGFEISKMDLMFRGAGNFTGTEQHGDMSFRYFDIYGEESLIDSVVELLNKIDIRYPEDSKTLHRLVQERIDRFENLSSI